MNQLCKVCGEPAAGFHFGAFTCEGCKSFFGRTYNNISAIAGCKNSNDCVINKKNRTACKACRLRKCLLVGMSKSGSRYGRRSNWFKIHCLLQDQQTQQPPGGGGIGSGGSAGSGSNFEQLARLHQMQARQTYQDKTNPCIKTASMSPTLLNHDLPPSFTHNQVTTPTQHNFFAAAKFLNGIHDGQRERSPAMAAIKSESRLSDTPSDSGASSAGDQADDCTSSASGRHPNERNCSSAHQTAAGGGGTNDDTDERDRRRKQFLEIFRSHSEPLRSPFAPFAITNLPPPPILAGTPPIHCLPALWKEENNRVSSSASASGSTEAGAQDEPIDLSLKSRDSRRSQTPHSHSSTLSPMLELSEAANVIAKPAPLDLTLVRTQTLTG